jgi:hypothetical protein
VTFREFIDKSNVFHNVGLPFKLVFAVGVTSASSTAVFDPPIHTAVHLFGYVRQFSKSDQRTTLTAIFHLFSKSFFSFIGTAEEFLSIERTTADSNVDMSAVGKKEVRANPT